MATTFKLSAQEKADSGFTHAFQLLAADLTETATNTAQSFVVGNAVAGTIVLSAALHMPTAIEDASDAAFNDVAVTLGDGVNPDAFIVSTQLNVNGTEITTMVALADLATLHKAYTGADTIDLVVNSMTAKALNDIDTGEVWVFWKQVELATLKG